MMSLRATIRSEATPRLSWVCFLASLLAMTAFTAQATSPVVVEVFVSQGCSSCPPAEKLLSQLHQDYGDAILPLSFHVDYWDQLGWKDPFSSADYTQRQQSYVYVLHEDSPYTPEMVIQGEVGFVGSDARRARYELDQRVKASRPVITMKRLAPAAGGKAEITFSVPKDLARKTDTLTVIVYENAPPIHVERGENAKEIMSGDFAVRRLTTETVKEGDHHLTIPLEAGWVASKTGVAVLAQGGSHEILAAQNLYPLEDAHARM